MRRQVVLGFLILFVLLVLLTQVHVVEARSFCDNANLTDHYCNLKTSLGKESCLGCQECEVYYPDYASNPGDWSCEAVKRTGAQCAFYLTEEECMSQHVETSGSPQYYKGCIWSRTAKECVDVNYSNNIPTGISCSNPEGVAEGIYCDTIGAYYGDPEDIHDTHLGHDVWCRPSIENGNYYLTFNYNAGTRRSTCLYNPISPPPRGPEDNCTCYSTNSSEEITSPLVCLAFDTRKDYNCPPGYTFYNVSCVADLDGDGYFGTFQYKKPTPYLAENNACDTFCDELSPDHCLDPPYNKICQVVDDGYCRTTGVGNDYNASCTNKTTAANCLSENHCEWIDESPDQRCIQKDSISLGKVGVVSADDCNDSDSTIGTSCPINCRADVDTDNYGNASQSLSVQIPSCDDALPCGNHIGNISCSSLPYCSWVDNNEGSCNEAYDCSQNNGDFSDCTSHVGCYWNSSSSCQGGTVQCLDYNPSCGGAPSCSTPDYQYCDGGSFVCYNVHQENECNALEQCHWNGGSCTPVVGNPAIACSNLAPSQCPTQNGGPCTIETATADCSTGNSCTDDSYDVCEAGDGNPDGYFYCPDLNETECTDLNYADYCEWQVNQGVGECFPFDPNNQKIYCDDIPASDCPISSPLLCKVGSTNYCDGGSWTCESYTAGDSCESQAGCEWTEVQGQCKNYDCSNFGTLNSCGSVDTCAWSSAGYLCEATGSTYPLTTEHSDCNDLNASWHPHSPYGPPENCTACPNTSFNSYSTPAGTMSCLEGATYILDFDTYVNGTYPPYSYTITNDSSNSNIGSCYIKYATSELWCQSYCTGGETGLFNVTVSIADSEDCVSPGHIFSIQVSDENHCPTMSAIPTINTWPACDSSPLFFASDYASDADNDSLSYGLTTSSNPSIAEFSVRQNDSAVTAIAYATGGAVASSVYAEDYQCASTPEQFVITNFVNTMPYFNGLNSSYNFSNTLGPVYPGYYFLGNLTEYGVDDDGDALSYSFDNSTINPAVGAFIVTGPYDSMFFKPTGKGTTSAEVFVEDCIENSSQILTFNVLNNCPNMDYLRNNYYLAKLAPETVLVNLSEHVSDPDGDNLTFSLDPVEGPKANCTIINGDLLACIPLAVGTQSFNVYADDGECNQSKLISVTVIDEDTCHVDADEDGFGNETAYVIISHPTQDYCEHLACSDFGSGDCDTVPGCSWSGGVCTTVTNYTFLSNYSMYTWPANNLGETEGDIIWDCDDDSEELSYLCCASGSYFVWQRSTYKGNMSNVYADDYPSDLEPENLSINKADNRFVGACCSARTDCVYGDEFYNNNDFGNPAPNIYAGCYSSDSVRKFGGGVNGDNGTNSMYCGDDS